MTSAECRAFLAEGARTMQVATVRPDGRPHVAPVWFALDGDTIVFTTAADSVKAINLAHDPRISLCVDDETPPFAYVLIAGTAAMSDDLDQLLHWATQISGRYMGTERAEAYGRRNGVPGELLVRVAPSSVIGRKRIAD
jgi:PPOX class probable F420-dependent enzyme